MEANLVEKVGVLLHLRGYRLDPKRCQECTAPPAGWSQPVFAHLR
jgi:hypothetical protein